MSESEKLYTKDGADCFTKGWRLEDNPHDPRFFPEQHADWERGWTAAKRDDDYDD